MRECRHSGIHPKGNIVPQEQRREVDHNPDNSRQCQSHGHFSPLGNIMDADLCIFRELQTRRISQEQLVNEVKGIYAGLVIVSVVLTPFHLS